MTNSTATTNLFMPMRMPGRLMGIKNKRNNTVLPIESGFVFEFILLISLFSSDCKPRTMAHNRWFVLHRTGQVVDVNFMQARKNFVVDVGDIEQLIHTLQQIKKRETA